MQRYQIRVPENLDVEDVIEEMAGKAWDRILHFLDPQNILVPLKNYRRFQNALYRSSTPCFLNHKVCGLLELCSDQVTAGPLEYEFQKEPGRDDRIYHIIVDADIETFIENLVCKGFEALESVVKPERASIVLSSLRETFTAVLGDYLYINRACGSENFCDFEERNSVVLQ